MDNVTEPPVLNDIEGYNWRSIIKVIRECIEYWEKTLIEYRKHRGEERPLDDPLSWFNVPYDEVEIKGRIAELKRLIGEE